MNMNRPTPGSYSFINYTYLGPSYTPTLMILAKGSSQFENIPLPGYAATLQFDTSSRCCTGWHDLENGTMHPCPDEAVVVSPYHECRHCQLKTGFNPAFYNTDTISPQQQARNKKPHTLYLAHFGPSIVKVGISFSQRGLGRLLDQGARSALILATLSTAEEARQYEAKIAQLPGIVETVQSQLKTRLLKVDYDNRSGLKELLQAREKIATHTDLTLEDVSSLSLDQYYFSAPINARSLIHLNSEPKISGEFIGMIGETLVARQNESHYYLPIRKLRGSTLHITQDIESVSHAPQQTSLF